MATKTAAQSSKFKPPAKWAELECCTRSGYALVSQGLATIVRVAQSEDLKHALLAGQWLVTYGEGLLGEQKAEKLRQEERAALKAAPTDREVILSELRGLYQKALGSSPLVEAIPEDQSEPIEQT